MKPNTSTKTILSLLATALLMPCASYADDPEDPPRTYYGSVIWFDVGDNVSVTINNPNTNNPHGFYSNGSASYTAGKNFHIEVNDVDADGIRTNPSGYSDWMNSTGTLTIGDGLIVTVKGESSDCANINGYAKLIIGDNAQFYAEGTYRSGGEGSHGLRANHGAQITVGANAIIETIAENSYAVYSTNGSGLAAFHSSNPKNGKITLGDNATITTNNSSSYAVYAQATNGVITFEGTSDITTKGSKSHGIYASGTSARVDMEDDTKIVTENSEANGIYAGGTSSVVNLTGKTDITTKGSKSHGIYTSGSSAVVNLGNSTIINNGSSNDSYSVYAYAGKVQGTGKFVLDNADHNASLYARNGIVDITMQDTSVFNGYTGFLQSTSTGKIYLGLESNSNWTLSQSSELSTLSVDETSSVTFTLYGQNTCTSILARESAQLDSRSVMEIFLDGYDPVAGDEFLLVSVMEGGVYVADDVVFDFTRAVLDDDLDWDTSTFSTDGTIRVVSLNPIPEPLTATLGFVALGLMTAHRRRF